MSSSSVKLLVPYIRLTKDADDNYTLWTSVFIPQNYSITGNPTVEVKSSELVQVNINVEGTTDDPSSDWTAVPQSVVLPNDGVSDNAEINVTVLTSIDGVIGDPEDNGSTEMSKQEAEPDV